MRRVALSAAMLVALYGCASQNIQLPISAVEQTSFSPAEGVDHILLWTRDVDEDSKVLGDKLGFNVVVGGTFPGDVANRLVYFGDQSYLELLYFTVPLSQLGSDGLKRVEFLALRDGSVGFGIRADDLDKAAARVASAGLSIGELSPGAFDPDGPQGPLTESAAHYRTFGFDPPPIPGLDPFFVWYAPRPAQNVESRARRLATTSHPNTAQRLTAVWLLTEDPVASAAALNRMGFSTGRRVQMPQIEGIGTIFAGGRSAIVLVEPRGSGIAREALHLRGPHMIGMSLEVADLAVAKGALTSGYGRSLSAYTGAFGKSVVADARDDLGVFIEFHSAKPASEGS